MVQVCVSVLLACVSQCAGFCSVLEAREGWSKDLRAWELNLPCREDPRVAPGLEGGSR